MTLQPLAPALEALVVKVGEKVSIVAVPPPAKRAAKKQEHTIAGAKPNVAGRYQLALARA